MGLPKGLYLLPKSLIYPTQCFDDLKAQTLGNVRNCFNIFSDFLTQAPLTCCAYPLDSRFVGDELFKGALYVLPLMDGHHRMQIAVEEKNFSFLPTNIYSIIQASKFYSNGRIDLTMEKLWRWITTVKPINCVDQIAKVEFTGKGFLAR